MCPALTASVVKHTQPGLFIADYLIIQEFGSGLEI